MSTSTEIHQLTPSSDDHTNTNKMTSQIYKAAFFNKWECVRGLFENRPELKTNMVKGSETPLMIAVGTNSSHEFVKQLLNNVTPLDHDCDKWCGVDTIGNNALHYAAMAGNIIDAKLMLKCLPETMTTIKNIHGNTPATLAAKLGRKDMIDDVFNEYAHTNEMSQVTYKYAETDLQIYKAALRNKWDDVRELFVERPELMTKPVNERLETPLMIAVGTNSSHEFVKQLLNNVQHWALDDDEWSGMNIHGNNALHYAAKVGNMIDAQLMVQCLPRMMQIVKNIHGDTPYLMAAKLGRKDMIDTTLGTFTDIGNLVVSTIQAGEIGAFEFHFTQLLNYSLHYIDTNLK
jgi:ankyrin repeat protein